MMKQNAPSTPFQVVAGVAIDACANILLYLVGFQALIALRWIVLEDDIDGAYSHHWREMAMELAVYGLILASFIILRQLNKFRSFATAGLVAHCIVRSVWTLLIFLSCYLNPFN